MINEINKKQKLIMDAMYISQQLDKLHIDYKSPKTLKIALYKIYQKRLLEIKNELEEIEHGQK